MFSWARTLASPVDGHPYDLWVQTHSFAFFPAFSTPKPRFLSTQVKVH